MKLFRSIFVSLSLPALAHAQTGDMPPTVASTSLLPHDLSVWGMFTQADWLVQAVMVGLAVASVLTWTVFVAKSLELAAAARRQRATLAAVERAASLANAPASDLVAAAQAELKLSPDAAQDREGLKEPRGWNGSRRAPAGACSGVPECSPPSAPPRPSSACSARCGAS